jgi:hypothetical protein
MRTTRETGRLGWWALAALASTWPLLAAQCPPDGGSSGSSSGGLSADGTSGGDGTTGTTDGSATSDDGHVDFHVCLDTDCGPALGMPNWICADGTVAGPTGQCMPTADGGCGWEVVTCPDDGSSGTGGSGDGGTASGGGSGDGGGTASGGGSGGGGSSDGGTATCASCPGPAPGMANWICDDGSLGGPSCEPDANGTCGWVIRDCPGGGSGGGGGGDTCDACPGPAPGMPNYICPDGTIAGPSCQAAADGTCGWVIVDCPDSGGGGTCDPDACPSPAPGMPNWICDDGTVGGPSCQPDADGNCGWIIVQCPDSGGGGGTGGDGDACPSDQCPRPAPGMANWLCDDGSVGGPACLYDADGSCSWHILECP